MVGHGEMMKWGWGQRILKTLEEENMEYNDIDIYIFHTHMVYCSCYVHILSCL